MKKKILTIVGLNLLPIVSLAASGVDTSYIDSVLKAVGKILNGVILLLISLAIVWFIWNVIRYAMSKDLEKKGEAKDQMVWGIIAITVCVSIWGIIALLRSAFGVDGSSGAPSGLDNMIPLNQSSSIPSGTTFDSSGNAYAPGSNPFNQ